jgi:hypothetical protein
MIERATERRIAEDWRGACAAAGVDIALDLDEIANLYGRQVAAAVENDLLNFAPDLLRWHAPRFLYSDHRCVGALRANKVIMLARYSTDDPPEPCAKTAGRPHGDTGHWLQVALPHSANGRQRLRLAFGHVEVPRYRWEDWTHARHLWDAERSHELLERCGGFARAPFFRADGTLLPETELPEELPETELPNTEAPRTGPLTPGPLTPGPLTPGPPDRRSRDAAEQAEWVTVLHERGEIEAAFAAAGIELASMSPRHVLARIPLAPARLADEARLAGHDQLMIFHRADAVKLEVRPSGVRAELVPLRLDLDVPTMAEACWRRLPDLDLLRTGWLSPQALHPLVHAALFPAATTPALGPPDPIQPGVVRVRCRDGEWHEVGPDLSMPHDQAERDRERVMKAFGGTIAGCFAAEEAWVSGSGWLPKALRERQRDLFRRAQHGDTPGVLRLLDAGIDPRVRDRRRRTLLHMLHLVHHEALLPRLLRAGLDLEATDQDKRTPLHVAVDEGGSAALVEALLTAGARVDVVDRRGLSLRDVISQRKRTDLAFLHEPPAG